MTTGGGFRGYRWRRLTPEQAVAVREAVAAGADLTALAKAYGVSRRTLYRATERARKDVIAEARVDGWRATYAITDEGPVQLTHWVPAEQDGGERP